MCPLDGRLWEIANWPGLMSSMSMSSRAWMWDFAVISSSMQCTNSDWNCYAHPNLRRRLRGRRFARCLWVYAVYWDRTYSGDVWWASRDQPPSYCLKQPKPPGFAPFLGPIRPSAATTGFAAACAPLFSKISDITAFSVRFVLFGTRRNRHCVGDFHNPATHLQEISSSPNRTWSLSLSSSPS